MPNSENEKKGIIYEAFVKLAVHRAMNIVLLWERDIPGVIANQDFVYPSPENPELVFAVTHWGSHEAANKKFWRTVEDRCEVYNAFPTAKFISIVFEKNPTSDDALDEQLRLLCFGRNLSERNSPAIVSLQRYVDTDEKVRAFGSGKDVVFSTCNQIYQTDETFQQLINSLGSQISQMISATDVLYQQPQNIMQKEREWSSQRRETLVYNTLKETYYKMAIIKLIRFSDIEVSNIVYAVKNSVWNDLSSAIVTQLVSLKLVKFVGVSKRAVVDPILQSLAIIGTEGYIKIKNQLGTLINTPGSPYSAYRDHYIDITNSEQRRIHYDYLISSSKPEELLQVENGILPAHTNRAWVLDYYLALKRKNSPRGEYGFQKLSAELGIRYTAGGIVSPLPRYAAGYEPNISAEEKQRLYKHICDDIPTFDFSKISDVTIADDRNVTLMKKLDVIGVLIKNAVDSLSACGCSISSPYRVYSPIEDGMPGAAAATDYNFLIEKGNKSAIIFVVSAYDASHKHKELSGRLRLGRLANEYPSAEVINIIVFDGTMFSSRPDGKIKMLYNAGWDYLYYVDELDNMSNMLRDYFTE